jgi:aromatic-amino-acid transaminase
VEKLRKEHGVYMVGDGRINVAGLPEDRLDALAAAVVSVVGQG